MKIRKTRRKNMIRAMQLVHKSKILNTALLLIRSVRSGKIVGAKILYNAYWSHIPDGEDAPHDGVTIDLPEPKNRRLYNSDLLHATTNQLSKDPRIEDIVMNLYKHTNPTDNQLAEMIALWKAEVGELPNEEHPGPIRYWPYKERVLNMVQSGSWKQLADPVQMPPVIATSSWRIF